MLLHLLLVLLATASARTTVHPAPPCLHNLRQFYSPAKLRRLRIGMQVGVMRYHRGQRALAYAILARHGSPAALMLLPDDLAAAEQGRFGDDLKHLTTVGATYCR
jgi:hypothetical protein